MQQEKHNDSEFKNLHGVERIKIYQISRLHYLYCDKV